METEDCESQSSRIVLWSRYCKPERYSSTVGAGVREYKLNARSVLESSQQLSAQSSCYERRVDCKILLSVGERTTLLKNRTITKYHANRKRNLVSEVYDVEARIWLASNK